jgi:hypothetical protein
MSFTASITENIRKEAEKLIEMVNGEISQDKTAHAIEDQLWWELMAMGQQLMQLFFTTHEEQEVQQKVYEVDDVGYGYTGQKERRYVSLFGEVIVRRASYWHKGIGSKFPLDETLSLPQRSFSDLVQERIGELSVSMPYGDAVGIFSKWLRLDLSKRSSEQVNADHTDYVRAYYESRDIPETAPKDIIMVASADGKGIRMTRQDSPPPEARRGRGNRKTAKKEATVTALYTISPYKRGSDDIIRALLAEHTLEIVSQSPRPIPTGKQIFGTLDGQKSAFVHLTEQIARRDASQFEHYIALIDGNRGLKNRILQDLPKFITIVDIIHVTEYLWEAGNTLLGETHYMRKMWMQDALRCVLEDKLDTLLEHLKYQLTELSKRKRTILEKVIRYLHNNRDYMNYQDYLAKGYPIGTGVIEGACRYLVKDRFERAGMRWSKDGAQVMLDLRATYLNGDWDDFQKFRRHQAHEQRYGSSHPDVIPENIMLSVAA